MVIDKGPIISKMNPPNPWIPEDDKVTLAVLGKLGEELNELGAAVSRCVIQGARELHPVTGKSNLQWLEEEIADVIAGCQIATTHFNLSQERIGKRIVMKTEHKLAWHKLIKDAHNE